MFDESEEAPGSLWTEDHWSQGFVRREKTVAFATIDQAGLAVIRVLAGVPSNVEPYQRAICVPLRLPTGRLRIEGPEEYPVERFVEVEPGDYVALLGQRFDAGGVLVLDLFIDSARGRANSEVVKADPLLKVRPELLESAEPA
jgi:hypothetical protein